MITPHALAAGEWPQPTPPRGWINLEKLEGVRIGQWLPCDETFGNTNDCIKALRISKLDGSISGELKYISNPKFDPYTSSQEWQIYETDKGPLDNYASFKDFPDLSFELPKGFTTANGSNLIQGHVSLMSGGLQFFFHAGELSDSLPTDSTLEIEVVSKNYQKVAGWILGNIKEPQVKFSSGELISVAGVPQKSPVPSSDCTKLDLGNEDIARSSTASFAVNIASYNGDKAFSEVVLSTNGWWCFNGVEFDKETRQLVAKVGTSHFDENKKEVDGWIELKIFGRIARDWWKIDPASASGYAKVEVSYTDGTSKLATVTVRYDKPSDTINLRAYGFHFSKPAIKMSFAQPTVIDSKGNVPKRITLKCAKGKMIKKISGSAPRCPVGYKKVAVL